MAPVRFFILFRVYADEAGDRGISPQSSDHFVVSAVVVDDSVEAQTRRELAALRQELGRQPAQALHFRQFTHPQKVKAAQDTAAAALAVITNVIICKRHLHGVGTTGNLAMVTRPDTMYLWALRLLLERVSWYIRDHGGGSSIVTFAHVRRFKVQKLHDYRGALENSVTNIHWPSFAGHRFNVSDPTAMEMLQFADIAASALFHAVESDRFGNVEERYLRELGTKLYRYSSSPITSYGLKVFPPAQANAGGSLHRLREF